MIRAEVGDIQRFPSGAHLASYAGLVPRVDSQCRPHALWSDHATRLAVVALGTDRRRRSMAPKRSDRIGRWGRRLALTKAR